MKTPNLIRTQLGIGMILLGCPAGAIAASTNFQSVVLADAPVLYYQFNESQGAATNHGSLGAAFDAT
jgi:peptidase E